VARAELARWLGLKAEQIVIAPGAFLQLPPPVSSSPPFDHPRVRAQAARLEAAKATESAAARMYVPRVFVQSTTYARGSSATASGTIGEVNGFALGARNWAAGVNVTFPLFDAPVLRQRHALEIAREQEALARYDQAVQDLAGDSAKADAVLVTARKLASLTPVQVDAARAAEEQARARYTSGLGTIAEVADTARLLTDSEISNALAVLSVWRAELGVAAAHGDLSPLLALGQGGR
jgi:outer membrane protein